MAESGSSVFVMLIVTISLSAISMLLIKLSRLGGILSS